jgi:(1->4)-alpha-D-glucan 1-alpha-D-glucosylmutase
MTLPLACYRLQLSAGFTLHDARAQLPYLDRLGVDVLYLSPVLTARTGSDHGYDVTDPTRVSEVLGGEEALRALAAEARGREMGLLLDIVPNHMAADEGNPWWWDVLRRGPASRFAAHFDIEWDAPGAGGKVVLPVLGRPPADELRDGMLALAEEDGERIVVYHDRRFPVAPGTADDADLAATLERQHYRLEFWRDGLRRVNYRRFFDVSELAALCAEDDRVFASSHRLVLGLLRDDVVRGFRVDHVDGLSEPQAYLRRLRSEAGDAYVVVEKILGHGERLRASWPVHGTTGYEFLAAAGGLFVDRQGAERLARAYVEATGRPARFEETALAAKREVVDELFSPDVDRLLRRASQAGLEGEGLRRAVTELTVQLDVYRTYAGREGADEEDRARIEQAVSRAVQALGSEEADLARRVADVLELPDRSSLPFAQAWQQMTGPVAAKGVEDTALYRDARLLSRNEPGLEPAWLSTTPAEYHAWLAERGQEHPLNATSTHDTKRGEDVRARISALTHVPDSWLAAWERWQGMNDRCRVRPGAPSRSEEWLIYQVLIGAWPFAEAERGDFAGRMEAYVEKALREAKEHTTWLDPDEEYESAVKRWLRGVLDPSNVAFLEELDALARTAGRIGAEVSLGHLVLKLLAPGAPDIYWGNELWQLTLVDPDNRRPVDFDGHSRLLATLEERYASDPVGLCAELADGWQDGRIKLLTTWAGLHLRRRHPELFRRGRQVPLEAGDAALAVGREIDGAWAVGVVPLPGVPKHGALRLPATAPDRWRHLLTGEELTGHEHRVSDLLAVAPVALLEALS